MVSKNVVMEMISTAMFLVFLFSVCFLLLNPSSKRLWDDVYTMGAWTGLPGGAVFDLLVLLVLSFFAGKVVSKIGLPPLAGMLIMGFILRLIGATDGINSILNSKVRDVALAIIMTRAGLGLDVQKLWAKRSLTMTLSTVPMICEAITVALVACEPRAGTPPLRDSPPFCHQATLLTTHGVPAQGAWGPLASRGASSSASSSPTSRRPSLCLS